MSPHTSTEKRPVVEPDAVAPRRLWVTSGVALLVVVASVFIANAIRHAAAPADASPPGAPAPATDQIGIVEHTSIRDTRRGLDERVQQEESLRHFGWVDRAHGIARIPIDRAMDLVTDPAFTHRAFALDGGP